MRFRIYSSIVNDTVTEHCMYSVPSVWSLSTFERYSLQNKHDNSCNVPHPISPWHNTVSNSEYKQA